MYLLEGNIGVGKSTFLKLLGQQLPEISVIPEPKDSWACAVQGQSLLDNFYKDPKRWAYTIETLASACRIKDHIRLQKEANPNRIMERSVYSGHYCFARNGREEGYVTDVEWNMYNQWADFLIHNRCSPPKGFIYLKADPEVCFSRISKRNRKSEESISFDYITKIGTMHDQFLIDKHNVHQQIKNIPVLIIDANNCFVDNQNEADRRIDLVKSFLKET